MLYGLVLAAIAVLVEDDNKGDAAEVEFLLQVAPFGTGDVDVLAPDVVGFEERLTLFGRVVRDVEILHGLVFVGLHIVAHAEHIGTARSARHFPKVNVEHVAFVWFDDALENAVTFGH